MSSQKVKDGCCLKNEESKIKKWVRKTKKGHLNKKVTLMKMSRPSRSKKLSSCYIQYTCKEHGTRFNI